MLQIKDKIKNKLKSVLEDYFQKDFQKNTADCDGSSGGGSDCCDIVGC